MSKSTYPQSALCCLCGNHHEVVYELAQGLDVSFNTIGIYRCDKYSNSSFLAAIDGKLVDGAISADRYKGVND